MRLGLVHVYWMLLIISVVSSALLFLIVASENFHNGEFNSPGRDQDVIQNDSVSFINNLEDKHEASSGTKPNIRVSSSIEPWIHEQATQDSQIPPAPNFQVPKDSEEDSLSAEIRNLDDSQGQESNISQKISDDNIGSESLASSILPNLVDSTSSASNLRPGFRSTTKPHGQDGSSHNASILSGDEQQQQIDDLARLSQLLGVANESSASSDGQIFTDPPEESSSYQDSEVVVVRAEKRSIKDQLAGPAHASNDDQIVKDDLDQEEVGSTAHPESASGDAVSTSIPELSDSTARARLVGNADESSAAIIDGIVTAGPGTSSEPHEDMPSFNEWAQKRLEEAEKKKTHPNASVQTANGSSGRGPGSMRMRSKNYASPDCGAKVVAANPESRSARSVLASTRDEYMLNTCTSRIWFAVELCEAIQAKKIELANFELFSSSPKDISVYVSDRFPTRDWQLVGQFTAKDERDVQSFALQPQLFGKFIKVELHSHYGSEHFCPISLFRAYGTSEFEVLETETETDTHADSRRSEMSAEGEMAAGSDIESEDDEDEDNVFGDEEESTSEAQSSALFGSARDAVLSIVKKAAEVLIKSHDLKSSNNITKIQESISGDVLEGAPLHDCITPLYSVACRDCDDDRFARVFQLISCKSHYLDSLLDVRFVGHTLSNGHLCELLPGSDCYHEHATNEARQPITHYYLPAQFLSSLFSPDYIIALCNVLAAREQRLFANVSHQEQQQISNTPNKTDQTSQLRVTKDERTVASSRVPFNSPIKSDAQTKTDMPTLKSKPDGATERLPFSESLITQIKPTKTKTITEDIKKQSPVIVESSRGHRLDDASMHNTEIPSSTELPMAAGSDNKLHSAHKVGVGSQERQQETMPRKEAPSSVKSPSVSEESRKTNEQDDPGQQRSEAESKSEVELPVKSRDSKSKVEHVEHDSKTHPQQEHLSFEGFDFKDLEGESFQSNGNGKIDPLVTQQAYISGTPQQKESVFLRLSNRIKALERNMSLSSQYLEELSRRYKKQVEEMQRSLERAVSAMNEESRRGNERDGKRVQEVISLRQQIDTLTGMIDDMLRERNSWRINFSSLLQHAIFVVVDVVVVILILSYCRQGYDDAEYIDEMEEIDERKINSKPKGSRTYEIVKQNFTQLTKKPKKRRPSEIASQVSGTYDQLMIEDSNHSTKRDRRKKRRKDLSSIRRTSSTKDTISKTNLLDVPLKGATLHSRSASASDALLSFSSKKSSPANSEKNESARLESYSGTPVAHLNEESLHCQRSQPHIHVDRKIEILAMEVSNENTTFSDGDASKMSEDLNVSSTLEDDAFEREDSSPSSIRAKVKKLSSPSFMKTALGSRTKRLSFSRGSSKKEPQENTSTPIDRLHDETMGSLMELEASNTNSDDCGNGPTRNGHHADESDESRSSCATPTSDWSKKEKKTIGLKRMVRKFF
ncbi:hypothetical protein QAD02_024284 [Eretmocerus hayati]|uniref:Uncharacterized protein n=1 Tax=Eretmocerus hayati TaxID=131215 RepID=A0ACC2Q0U4_9HYME|nr:hypothetical protein QAD02_024284 [Eretmocerus hayati]